MMLPCSDKKESYLQQDLKILAEELEKKQFGGSTFLITGATGLIGSLLIRSICKFNSTNNHTIHVYAMARSFEKARSVFADEFSSGKMKDIEFIFQDIRKRVPSEVCCDYVVHTANSTSSAYFMTNPVEVIDSIYTGTKQILDFAVEKKVKGFVYLSSMEVFGKLDEQNRVSEENLGYLDIHNIRTCYSEGKRLAELLCSSYAKEYNVPAKIARLAQTFGAGISKDENRVFAQFAKSALKGEDIVLHTWGKSVGNYCYTTDAIRAILLILKDGIPGEAYTVVNEETTRTIAEMAELVATSFSDGKSKVVFDIPDNNKYGYAPDTKIRLSAAKIRKLGWIPQYSLKEMYLRMISDYSGLQL